MKHHSDSGLGRVPSYYDANYGNFQTDLYRQVREEAFGEDIGQNSWLTTDEQDKFLSWIDLGPGKTLLDVACGAGGPALRIAAKTRCAVIGVDIHEQAICNAQSLANDRGLDQLASFRLIDARQPLPFPDASFDAITCIDAVNHLSDRPNVIAEWGRVLKANGRLLFTDPIIVTGPLTNAEIAIRSSAGHYLFVPFGYNESTIAKCGLRVLVAEDVTSNMAKIAERRMAARCARSTALRDIEGDEAYERQQQFLETTARLAQEVRLSRFVYVASR